jgi:hypothetical protein
MKNKQIIWSIVGVVVGIGLLLLASGFDIIVIHTLEFITGMIVFIYSMVALIIKMLE